MDAGLPRGRNFSVASQMLKASRQARFSRPRRVAAFSEESCGAAGLYATIFVKRPPTPTGTAGQRLHTGQNLLSVALLGNGLQVQTGDYTAGTPSCQAHTGPTRQAPPGAAVFSARRFCYSSPADAILMRRGLFSRPAERAEKG